MNQIAQRGGPSPSAVRTGFSCNCPRHGQGPLFEGFPTPGACSTACGQDCVIADACEGPAMFVTVLAGFPVPGRPLVAGVRDEPSGWSHAPIWPPLTAPCLKLQQPLNGLTFDLQDQHRAGEVRPSPPRPWDDPETKS